MWLVMYAFVLSFMIVSMYDVKSYACEVAVVEEVNSRRLYRA